MINDYKFLFNLFIFLLNYVAPNTYCPEKVNQHKTAQYSFGQRTSMERRSDSPGIISN